MGISGYPAQEDEMSRNGKGDGNRISNQPKFNEGHVRSYGKIEKVDGRRTIMVVSGGKVVTKQEMRR